VSVALAYADARGRFYFDDRTQPLSDTGVISEPLAADLIPAPDGTVPVVLPEREPLVRGGRSRGRTALGALLPAGFTRLAVPAYAARPGAPTLPLFGYTFACAVGDELHVAAMRTDEAEDWSPRRFAEGELEAILQARTERAPRNRVLRQLALCSLDYGCFTAQNVFLEQGEAALPVSPVCNARCVGCISELDADAGIPSPQTRIRYEAEAAEIADVALHHLQRVPQGIVSFGQGCEGEPLLRSITIAEAIRRIRAQSSAGTINLNTNGSLPKPLAAVIGAGLQAIRISLNSFRPEIYAAYYRPIGYSLEDVFESVRLAAGSGVRVSLNLLTHPGVTDDEPELEAMERALAGVNVAMIQTRTLNIDPEIYFARAGRPRKPLGMRAAIGRIRAAGIRVGNFTHAH
jgi:pyruvate-formate lyase-activating enzyme